MKEAIERLFCCVVLMISVSCYKDKDVKPVTPDYPPPYPWVGDKACENACYQLRAIRCPEGYGSVSGASCERTCQLASELRPLPLECWIKSTSAVEARSCGSLRCIQ